MKKSIKKLFALVTMLCLCTAMAMPAFAAPPGKEAEENEEFIHMVVKGDPKERINSEGEFTFNVHSAVQGNKFKVNSSTVTIRVEATTRNSQNQPTNGKVTYNVYMKHGLWGNTVLEVTGITNDGSRSNSASNLDTNATYYLRVHSQANASDYNNYYVVGSGTVSNVSWVE